MHLCRIKSASIIYQCISKTKAQIIFATRAWQVPLIIRLSLELNAMLWIQTRSDVSREADESPATRPSAVTTRVCAALLSLTRSASLTPVCAICRLRFVHPSRPVQSDRWRIFVLEWERMTTANWKMADVCVCALRIQSPACWRHYARPSSRAWTRYDNILGCIQRCNILE